MAAPDLPLVLAAVGELDREVTRLTRRAAVLGGPLSPREHVATLAKLGSVVERANCAVRVMRDRILDTASELTVDRFESAFRARSIVVQIQLQTLRELEPRVGHRLWPSARQFQSLEDVSAFLLDRIGC